MAGARNSTSDATPTTGPEPAGGGPGAAPVRLPDDAELLRRVAAGDPAAFRALVDRHGRYLFGIARSLVGSAADAEDVVQETLVAVLDAATAGRFRGESAVRTYMVSILVRQAGLHRRKAGRRSETVSATEPDAAVGSESPAGGVDARLDLDVMLGALSLEHRQVVVLRELEGLSYEEIAAALGVPRGTVESRLHRARAVLRERFKGYLEGSRQ